MRSNLLLLLVLCMLAGVQGRSQRIQSVKLFRSGDQTSFPLIQLGSSDQLELHFDDLDGDVKNYYFSFQLCNADWTPALWNTFDYTRGFHTSRARISRWGLCTSPAA